MLKLAASDGATLFEVDSSKTRAIEQSLATTDRMWLLGDHLLAISIATGAV